MIQYTNSIAGLQPSQLKGFFDGWANPPSVTVHLKLLKNSDAVILAVDNTTNMVVGFITAISDGVLSAHITFFEVVPEYKGKGIGSELTGRMLNKLKDFYSVSLMCDPELQPFYRRLGMSDGTGMNIRNYEKQNGA
jgi:ribosomal protein S18 acetylase RimI-like enzyme